MSLERLCERILTEHDYDLAVLAQWDGRRRYANLRKLARLARSYEELRGPDVEGFVRFVRELGAVGASELEAVAEEEGTDVIRLLTIHGAKGLEFKVVVVADAGRHGASRDADEILCLPDGRLGFRVADPATGKRRPTSDYEEVKEVEDEAAEAERRRLYYVAMTRAIDRLIVSGSIDPDRGGDESTPIGWVLERLEATELDDAADGPVEIERDGARLVLRLDRFGGEEPASCPPRRPTRSSSRSSPCENGKVAIADAPKLPELVPMPEPPENRCAGSRTARSPSSSAARTASTQSGSSACARRSLRAGKATATAAWPRPRSATPCTCCSRASTSAHRGRPTTWRVGPGALPARDRRGARADQRASSTTTAGPRSPSGSPALAGATVERSFAFEHDGVLLHGRLDVFHEADGHALVVDYKTNVLGGRVAGRDRRARVRAPAARLRARVPEGRGLGRRGRLPVPRAPRRPGDTELRGWRMCPALRRSCRGRSRRSSRVSSSRRRATTPARPAPRSTSSVQARAYIPRFVAEARRRVGPKRNRIVPIIERLAAEHQDATIALRFRSDLELLVSVMLSAQTTDVNVNRVTERLFLKYRRPEDYLAVPVEELEDDIRPTGFFRQKTKWLRGTMKMLIEEFDGKVPRRLDELVRLPGVARKTANVVASELGETQGIVVDTHVRPPLAAARAHEAGRPGEDRARPDEARPARALGRLPAPADLARTPSLPRAQAALRGVRPERPVPSSRLATRRASERRAGRRPRRTRGRSRQSPAD